MGKTVVVVGATGKQGGAVAAHLLADGWHVRALTRDALSPAASALTGAGAEVVVADMDDPASLERAFDGADGVFSVQPAPHDPGAPVGYSTGAEVRWGRNVADAAAVSGVAHLVYASLVEAAEHTGVPSFDSKWEVEQHIRSLGLPATVLRPVTFMDGLVVSKDVLDGSFTHVLDPDTRYQLIGVDDIGAFAALVFGAPEQYVGRSLTIAGDERTPRELAAVLGRALGHPVAYHQIPMSLIRRHDPGLASVFEAPVAPKADVAGLRAAHPGLMTFEAWLSRHGRAQLAAL
ncbi:NmrA/HSCARG family protein [Umezawaea sp. Da 62-37]|uniref:NmrA/HSCARG family protein n=1 Tax=Umezawaea sp. Da 62-37 TaxID=3075927 RepID=UPI0028F7301B|nr:NmrA/HSCARG family protein [Umezawaea sp. Da 62-37]WNV89490.1 NmrA/HSCARG family protein [Umezawaea sp. Da 62-37]